MLQGPLAAGTLLAAARCLAGFALRGGLMALADTKRGE